MGSKNAWMSLSPSPSLFSSDSASVKWGQEIRGLFRGLNEVTCVCSMPCPKVISIRYIVVIIIVFKYNLSWLMGLGPGSRGNALFLQSFKRKLLFSPCVPPRDGGWSFTQVVSASNLTPGPRLPARGGSGRHPRGDLPL